MNSTDLIYGSRLYKLFKPFYSGMGHVLMYHRVGDDDSLVFTKDLQVSPGTLEQTIQYFMARRIDMVSLDEAHRRLTSRKREKRFVAFTFDDGFRDNLTNGLPVFEKYDTPFALFLTTGFPDHKLVLWTYMLEDLILRNEHMEFSDEGRTFRFALSTMQEKRDAFHEIRTYILSGDQEDLVPKLKNIFQMETEELYSLTRSLALSWEEVRKLSDHPLVTIGSHTVNHLALRKLPGEQAKMEIEDARTLIGEKTGKAVEHMAYPYGAHWAAGPREYQLAAEAGLKLAFTTISSNVMKHHRHKLHALPRIEMRDEWGDKYLDLYLNGFMPLLHRIYN